MIGNAGLTRVEQAEIRAHLRTLRTSLTHARDALMHFQADLADRDKLEPAARRVDDLMNMFASDAHNSVRGAEWLAEIQGGIEQVMNPRAAESLEHAREDLRALHGVFALPAKRAAGSR